MKRYNIQKPMSDTVAPIIIIKAGAGNPIQIPTLVTAVNGLAYPFIHLMPVNRAAQAKATAVFPLTKSI